MAGILGETFFLSILTASVSVGRLANFPGLKQVCEGWHGVRPWGVLSDLEGCDIGCGLRLLPFLGHIATGGRRIFFHLGLSCGVGDSLKFPLCQIIYSHWNGCGCLFYYWHLGCCSRSGYCRGRYSRWDWVHRQSWA